MAARLGPRRSRLVVAGDQTVVREAVTAALGASGFEVVPLTVDDVIAGDAGLLPAAPSAGLLLSRLEPDRTLRRALAAVMAFPVPWVVLTDTRDGTAWQELRRVGVDVVLHDSRSLDEVVAALSPAS